MTLDRPRRALCKRLAALASLVGLFAAALGAGESASATPCDRRPLTATADASVPKLITHDMGGLRSDLPDLADARAGRAVADVDTSRQVVSRSSGRYAEASLLRHRAPTTRATVAEQAAPPQASFPATAEVAGGHADGLFRARTGAAAASARWRPRMRCATTGSLTASSVRIADAELALGGERVPWWERMASRAGLAGASLPRLDHAGAASTSTVLKRVGGRRGVSVTGATSITGFALFPGTRHEILAKVLRAPRLSVSTAGPKSSSSVDYTAGMLEVTLSDGSTRDLRVPGNGFATDLGLDEFSRLTVRLYVAQARVVLTDNGIESEGALARLRLLWQGRDVADIAIGAVAASAAVGARRASSERTTGPRDRGGPAASH